MAMDLSEAVGLLAEERTFAESGAGFLKGYTADDRRALIQGQRLYAEAKAASDGAIERLLVVLAEKREREATDNLRRVFEDAVARRLAFSEHVNHALPDLAGSRNVLLDALAKPAVDLVKGLTDGGLTIWKEVRRADEVRRQSITSRIEAQRWRPFAEVESAI